MAKNKKPALGKANEARRKVEARELSLIMRERAIGNANGSHSDKRIKRLKTRNAQKTFALRDW